jgi:hypothetical protein
MKSINRKRYPLLVSSKDEATKVFIFTFPPEKDSLSSFFANVFLSTDAHFDQVSFGSRKASVTASRDRVAKDHRHHVNSIVDSILNVEQIYFDHEEASRLVPAVSVESSDSVLLASASEPVSYLQDGLPFSRIQSSDGVANNGDSNPEVKEDESIADGSASSEQVVATSADIRLINQTFSETFTLPRSDDHNRQMKETARNAILSRLKEYGVEAFTQPFTANKRNTQSKGQNIIGILPGKFRNIEGQDNILLVGAHYDTVSVSPGVDDNASGVIVLLELARLLSQQQSPLNHTVMFVGFDLEELVSCPFYTY